MLTCLAYCLDQELWKAIDYLKEQVRVLKEQQEKDKRILLRSHQRRRLAAKAQQLTRELLEQTTVLFTSDTDVTVGVGANLLHLPDSPAQPLQFRLGKVAELFTRVTPVSQYSSNRDLLFTRCFAVLLCCIALAPPWDGVA